MSFSKFILNVRFDNQAQKSYVSNEIKIQNDKIRITFIGDGGEVFYAVTLIGEDKVMFSSKGVLAYSFTLERGKKTNFIINALSGEILCEVFCTKLNYIKTSKSLTVEVCYDLSLGGNKSKNKLLLVGSV